MEKTEKDFLSDVTLDFLDDMDDLDIQNDEQFRFVQSQKRIDSMLEQNRRLGSFVKVSQI